LEYKKTAALAKEPQLREKRRESQVGVYSTPLYTHQHSLLLLCYRAQQGENVVPIYCGQWRKCHKNLTRDRSIMLCWRDSREERVIDITTYALFLFLQYFGDRYVWDWVDPSFSHASWHFGFFFLSSSRENRRCDGSMLIINAYYILCRNAICNITSSWLYKRHYARISPNVLIIITFV